jgi:archaellum biogenesis ATPase FlaH
MTRKQSAVLLKSILSKSKSKSKSVISLDTMDRAIRDNQQAGCTKKLLQHKEASAL